MIAVLGHGDMARSLGRETALDGARGRGGLDDLLAFAAGVFCSHVLEYLPMPGTYSSTSELSSPKRWSLPPHSAHWQMPPGFMHHRLARQMRSKGLRVRVLRLSYTRWRCGHRGLVGFELLEGELQLRNLLIELFGGAANFMRFK